MLPLAGALIGGLGALALLAALQLGLSLQLAACFAVFALIVATGALHEDGLADFADAAGGATIEQRLQIMKDSRLGTFGALALAASVLLRIFSLSIIARHHPAFAALVLVSTGAVSRTLAFLPLVLLKPARADGAGFAAQSGETRLGAAALITLLIALLPLCGGANIWRIVNAVLASAFAAYGVTILARKHLGGHTGDVAGATQQVAEITTYLVFAARI